MFGIGTGGKFGGGGGGTVEANCLKASGFMEGPGKWKFGGGWCCVFPSKRPKFIAGEP